MSDEQQIRVRRDARPQGIVAYVTIDRARRLNALNGALMAEFTAAMAELVAD